MPLHNHSTNTSTPTSLRLFLQHWTTQLSEAHIDSPRLSAEVLTAFACQQERAQLIKDLILTPHKELAAHILDCADRLLQRRLAGEPVAYLTGSKEFYGKDFIVTPHTLIPRPETELLIDEALNFAKTLPPAPTPYWLGDLGTGSGCIGVTLACLLPSWQCALVDMSRPALDTAKKNTTAHHCINAHCVNASFTFPIFQRNSMHMIISNPPYISETDYSALSTEVKNFEPKTALVPPLSTAPSHTSTGLEHAQALIPLAHNALVAGGLFLMEFGHTQGTVIASFFPSHLWANVTIKQDLAGLDRYVYAIRC